MRVLYLLSVWVHILAAGVWIGGMVVLALVLVPVVRRPEYRDVASSFIYRTGVRFRWVGWLSLGLLFLTGLVNLSYRGFGWEELTGGRLWRIPFGQTLQIKLLLVAAILLLSLFHDLFLGPKALAILQEDPTSERAAKWRRWASWAGRFDLLLALAVAALGVVLSRGGF